MTSKNLMLALLPSCALPSVRTTIRALMTSRPSLSRKIIPFPGTGKQLMLGRYTAMRQGSASEAVAWTPTARPTSTPVRIGMTSALTPGVIQRVASRQKPLLVTEGCIAKNSIFSNQNLKSRKMKKNIHLLKNLLTLVLICTFSPTFSQNGPGAIQGIVTYGEGILVSDANITVRKGSEEITGTTTDTDGKFSIKGLEFGNYEITFKHISYGEVIKSFRLTNNKAKTMNVALEGDVFDLADVIVSSTSRNLNDISRLPSVKGTAIYASKKNDVVLLDKINANLAVNNPRQVFAKVAGTNVWENDGTGIQLNVSNRGLSPNRSWEYNTRQNGYDIAADIIGYPDNYYTPTMEAVERIEVVRGAASLQYGTQMGGMMNFKMKEAPKKKDFEYNTKQTVGSYNLFNSYNSIGGRKDKVEYFGYFHHRSADGWRENADYRINSGYVSAKYQVNDKLKIGAEFTKMGYTLHLSAGVTDEQFKIDPQASNRERNWFHVEWNLPAITLDYDFGNGTKLSMKNFAVLSSRYSVEQTDPVNIPDDGGFRDLRRDEYRNYGSEIRFLKPYKMFRDTRNTFLIGVRVYDGKTTRGQGLGTDGRDPDFSFINPNALEYNNYTFYTTNYAVFGEHIFQITPRLSVTPGFRYEYIKVDFDGYFNDDGKLMFEDRTNTRSFPLLGGGIQYQINDEINFYANITEGFRGVHFNDMRVENPNLEVDPDVKDSDGYNADVGFRGQIGQLLSFDINAFILAYNDRIGVITREIDGEPRLYRTNIANSRNRGIESFVEFNLLKAINPSAPYSLSLFSSYAYIDSEYLNSQFKGNRVELAPEHLFKAGITFKGYHFSTTLNYTNTSSQYSDANNTEFTETGNQGLIPAYEVFDLSANYDIKNYTIAIGINNLLNTTYFTRRATSH
ncbi:MAG: TonB-dependent receptor [Phaeodactylibacter sp.]|nr:TonB-dependent receptor [Phaeodactylibacter sp.]